MKTAEEFISDIEMIPAYEGEGKYEKYLLREKFIEFAKLHVEAALKAASEKATEIQKPDSRKYVSKRAIINSYPLINIK